MGFSLSSAGFMVSLIPLFGILGAILGGVLPVRLGLRRPLLIVPGGLLMVFALLAILAPVEWVIPIAIAAFGVLGCIYLPSAMTLPSEMPGISPRQAGVMLAAAYSVGNIGSFLAPVMVGFLADQTSSYEPGLVMAATLSLSLVVCGYLLPETGPRAARSRAEARAME
jgi:cyanate permease